MRKMSPRCCSGCGRTYRHRQLIEAWTVLKLVNGKFVGQKEIRKYCMTCASPDASKKLISKKFVHEIMPALPTRFPALMRAC